MSKIDIELKLLSKEDSINKKINGIFSDNRIVYNDDEVKTTIVINDNIKLKRETKEYIMELLFEDNKTTKGSYKLTLYNVSIPLEIKTKELIIEDNYIKIKYNLKLDKEDKGIYTFELKYKNK